MRNEQPPRLIRRPEVQDRVGFGRTTLYTMVNEGSFPAPVQLGARAVAWRESEIDAWIESRTSTKPTAFLGEK